MPSLQRFTRTLCYCFIVISLGFTCLEVHAQTINYTYDALGRVRLVGDTVNGNRSYKYDPAGNRTKVLGPDFVAPTNPSSLVVNYIRGSSATVGWTAATDNVEVSNYEYNLNGGAWIVLNTSTSMTLTGLTPLTNYTFTLRAKDDWGNSSAAVSIAFKTTLDAPVLVNCNQNNGQYAWVGSWKTVTGAHHYIFRLVDNFVNSYPSNEPNNAIRVNGTSTPIMSIQTSSAPCKWVQACDVNNVCGPQVYW